ASVLTRSAAQPMSASELRAFLHSSELEPVRSPDRAESLPIEVVVEPAELGQDGRRMVFDDCRSRSRSQAGSWRRCRHCFFGRSLTLGTINSGGPTPPWRFAPAGVRCRRCPHLLQLQRTTIL